MRTVARDEIDQKAYKTEEYEIEDLVQQSEIKRFCAEASISTTLGKPFTAKLLCSAIEKGSFILDDQSLQNFKELFERIDKAAN